MNNRKLIGICLLLFMFTTNSIGQYPKDTTVVNNKQHTNLTEVKTEIKEEIHFSKDVDSLFKSVEELNINNEKKLKTIDSLKERLNRKHDTLNQIRQDIKLELTETKKYLDEYIQYRKDSILIEKYYKVKYDSVKYDTLIYRNSIYPQYFLTENYIKLW